MVDPTHFPPSRKKPSQVLAYMVEAYAEPSDEHAEGVFEVNARTDDEALSLVKRDPAAAHYRHLIVKAGHVGVVKFTKVLRPKTPPPCRDAS